MKLLIYICVAPIGPQEKTALGWCKTMENLLGQLYSSCLTMFMKHPKQAGVASCLLQVLDSIDEVLN